MFDREPRKSRDESGRDLEHAIRGLSPAWRAGNEALGARVVAPAAAVPPHRPDQDMAEFAIAIRF
jgi:hypothetical protein